MPPRLLCLEITESAVMVDPERANTTLAELKALGVAARHRRLRHRLLVARATSSGLPVDIVKIDRSFVQGLLDGVEDAAIITAVIELARKLGLTTIAEGVEGLDQAERLRQMQCAVGQGFGLGRPGIAAAVAPLLTRERYSRAA